MLLYTLAPTGAWILAQAPSRGLSRRTAWSVVAAFCAGWLAWTPGWPGLAADTGVPAALLAWMRRHPAPGLVLAPYRDGGRLKAAGIPDVFVDGRTDLLLLARRRLAAYERARATGRFAPLVARYPVGTIVWPASWRGAPPPGWRTVARMAGRTVWRPASALHVQQ